MLLQTNSYVVPRDRKGEHARLVRRFRQTFGRLGCDSFEVYEQVGSNWSAGESSGRFVQIMRFRDRRHQLAVQEAERNDPDAQGLIAEFCDLINFPYQRQQGLFAVGFYIGVLPSAPRRQPELTDKTVAADELEEETAREREEERSAAEKKAAAPAKPAALVEPGAATRAPIVTPVAPGQVPLITPTVPGQVPLITPAPADEPEHAQAQSFAEADADEPAEAGALDAAHAAESLAEPIAAAASQVEGASIEIPAAPASEESSAAQGAGRWQTSDGIDDEIEPDADVSLDLSDTDETGRVRVADEALLKAEAEFAEYAADPTGAFDELKPKPPVLEGTLLDDHYAIEDTEMAPLNEDDALEALQLPDATGAAAPLPPINGQPAARHAHAESKDFDDQESEGEIDDLAPLIEDPADERKTTPPQPDEIRH